ncbi:MAG: putative Deflagellation inducible protein,13 kDa [Streblomastix strix]|uniref:Putative Deflagellation inducible protein,13 kDa n=1 Tax=Streblomastix strix TaxID=222440 RepID=A0A5J4UDC8_9EUKA|nr:MAG: putative Deflagellation inducible protein,13 kDa [Streblomastix strix]
MAQRSTKGGNLRSLDEQLQTCLEDLYAKKGELESQIRRDEEESNKITFDLRVLQERLDRLTESLRKRKAAKEEYDRTIAETESAYSKILESSKKLVDVLKQNSGELIRKKTDSAT